VALVRARVRIGAPPPRVWELLSDWEGSGRWMVDTTSVEVLGLPREGAGTRVRAVSTIAGVALPDPMVVTRWEPERLIVVRHTGWPIRGIGWFELAPDGGGARVEWAEELDPPLGPLGEAGARLLRRPIERILSRSLTRLRDLAEAGNRAPEPGHSGRTS
jgi:uncharacterized membrane protein